MSKEQYKELAKEWQEKLQLRRLPALSKSKAQSRSMTIRLKVLEYLLQNGYTLGNPATYSALSRNLNIDSRNLGFPESWKKYGIDFIAGGRETYRGWIFSFPASRFYVSDKTRAETSVQLIRKLMQLASNS